MEEFWSNTVDFLERTIELFKVELFVLGENPVTLSTLLYLLLALVLLTWLSGWLKRIISNRISRRYDINPGTVSSIATIVRYAILSLGTLVIIQSAGIDLSALSIMAGALGVGIGFGLQNITNNFISGLIILFEQPIKVGDRVTVGEINGNVVKIAPRATTVITNENITLIIPNSEFISNTVTNWSHNDPQVALKFPVGVAYNCDADRVREILLDVIGKTDGILKDPAPEVLFDEFGDSSINFIIWVWTKEFTSRPGAMKSILYYKIFRRFKEENIEIPFPQRDLHLRSNETNLPTSS